MNPCINSLTFVSRNPLMLKKLHNIILELLKANQCGIYDLLAKHGYTKRDLAILVDKRDYINDVDTVITAKRNVFYFTMESISAWVPNLLPIVTLLKEKYDNKIKLVSQSSEEGNRLYHTNDISGMFYPQRFKVDFCLNGDYETEFFCNWLDMITYLENHFEKADINAFYSISELEEAIDEAYDSDDEYFLTINMYTPYDDGESYSDYNKGLEVA